MAAKKFDDELAGYHPLLGQILAGKEFLPLLKDPTVERHRAEWRALITALKNQPPDSADLAKAFHTQWHVCHHYLRALVDDDESLVDMLWVWLPRYEGPDLILFRGENSDRFNAGRIGTAWSDDLATAEMFGGGNNAVGQGGLVLRTVAPASIIIAGPSAHSVWMDESEFTLDTRRLGAVEILSAHPARS